VNLLNSEQQAPSSDTWQPDQLAGFKVGDLADLPTIGRCEVLELLPPSLLRLRTSTGAVLKAGIFACRKVVSRTSPGEKKMTRGQAKSFGVSVRDRRGKPEF